MMALPVCAPVNLIRELTLWEIEPGHTPVVAGTVKSIVVALDKEIVVTPPNIESMVWKFGLSADVPQAPVRSPVFGTIRLLFVVIGSAMHHPFVPAGAFLLNRYRFLPSSVSADDSSV